MRVSPIEIYSEMCVASPSGVSCLDPIHSQFTKIIQLVTLLLIGSAFKEVILNIGQSIHMFADVELLE